MSESSGRTCGRLIIAFVYSLYVIDKDFNDKFVLLFVYGVILNKRRNSMIKILSMQISYGGFLRNLIEQIEWKYSGTVNN